MTEKDIKTELKNRPTIPDDDAILGVFGRLKHDISEIKTASSTRSSMDRSSESSKTADRTDRSSRSGRHSRQNSITQNSERSHKTPSVRSERPQETPTPNEKHRANGTEEKSEKKDRSVRSEKEKSSKSERLGNSDVSDDASRTSTVSRSSKQSSKRPPTIRQDSHNDSRVSNGDGRDSRAMSERSHRSSRRLRPGEWSTDQYLEAYHREWTLHYYYQQQQQQQQLGQPATYAFTAQQQHTYSQLPTSSSSAGLHQVAQQQPQPAVQTKTPVPPAFNHNAHPATLKSEQIPSVMNYPAPSSILRPPKEELPKIPAKPQKAEWKGCLLTANESSEISRSGRATTLLIKSHVSVEGGKDRTEIELFPGMMLLDGVELRNRVVDFGRHMSSLSNETAEYGTVELEAVFWDLVVHFVSRGEQSRPYEVAEVLMRLVQDTGRDSVASVRTGRDKYPEMHLYPIRKALLTGDVESAVKYAESGDCWELALCLQTVQSNLECRNQQANDLAVKALDQRLTRGDPVHTICCLACGRMPNVENCFRDWVANLAIVLACSSFVQQDELRLRFIGNLADLLSAANMSMARDICLMFCSSEKRFSVQPFSLIGAESDFEASSKFSLTHFFMTEAFVFLAQTLQGINLHTCVDLIKMELMFVEALVDQSLTQQATEYCKNIVLVIREYGVQLSFDLYAQLFHLSIACASSSEAVYQEDWLQWLWNIFTSYTEARAARKKSDSRAVRPRTLSSVSEKPLIAKSLSPVIPPSQSSGFFVEEPLSVFAREDDAESVLDEIHMSTQRRGSVDADSLARSRQNSISTRSSTGSRRPSESRPSSAQTSINTYSYSRSSALTGNQVNQSTATHGPVSPTHRPVTPPPSTFAPSPSNTAPPPMYGVSHTFPPVSNSISTQPPVTPQAPPSVLPAVASDVTSVTNSTVSGNEGSGAPSVPMFFSGVSQARPSFMNAFPTPQRIPDSSTPLSPSDPALNTGDAPYFSPNQQNTSDYAAEDEKENNRPTKMYDPTADFDEPDRAGGGKKSEAKKTKDDKAAEATKKAQNPGWFGSIFKKPLSIFKGRKQIHLPEDKKPTLVYDEVKKRWVDTNKSGEEEEEVVAPPPRMNFGPASSPFNQHLPGQVNQSPPGSLPFNGFSPQSQPLPGGFPQPPMPGQNQPNVNMFRIGAGTSPGGYNPYASLMTGIQAPPLKPVDMTNHFMPSPTIPEE